MAIKMKIKMKIYLIIPFCQKDLFHIIFKIFFLIFLLNKLNYNNSDFMAEFKDTQNYTFYNENSKGKIIVQNIEKTKIILVQLKIVLI